MFLYGHQGRRIVIDATTSALTYDCIIFANLRPSTPVRRKRPLVVAMGMSDLCWRSIMTIAHLTVFAVLRGTDLVGLPPNGSKRYSLVNIFVR